MLNKMILGAAVVATLAGAAPLTPAFAADGKVFRIGILGGENEADRLRNYQCLSDHVSKTLGAEVKLFPAADYDGVIQGLLGGTLDAAELGASGYAKVYLTDAKAVDPVLTTEQTDGSTGYHSIMIARKDSGIATLAESKGKTLAFADPDSTSGYLIPTVTLPKDLGMPVAEFYSKTDFAGGHEQVVLAVLDKKFDVGVTWTSGVGDFKDGYTSGNLRKMVDKGALDMKDVVELWQSPLIPNGPWVVTNTVPAEEKAKFVELLTGLPKSDPACFEAVEGGEYKGFVKVTPEFYEPIFAARKAQIGG
ncbi:MAG: phosphonate ABC transporter substrate-binding protein [Bosea sp.]|nr:phosphonate ABC transporter substrate-binding protein [Bosea sp. (in: a-proteobacteria)]